MNKVVKALLAVFFGAASIFCNERAQALTWTLNNVTFINGGKAVGQFDYDAAQNSYSGISITISDNSGYSYQYSSSSPASSNNSSSQLTLCGFSPYGCPGSPLAPNGFYLTFSPSLTNAGGTVNASGGYSTNNPFSFSSGSGTVSAHVPWEFYPQEFILVIPLFLGMREIKRLR